MPPQEEIYELNAELPEECCACHHPFTQENQEKFVLFPVKDSENRLVAICVSCLYSSETKRLKDQIRRLNEWFKNKEGQFDAHTEDILNEIKALTQLTKANVVIGIRNQS